MIRKIKKWLLIGIGIFLLFIIGKLIYNRVNHPIISSLPAKVEGIRQAVKLSTLDINTEEIFRDTINHKGIVSRVKSRVYISFDIENIPMSEQGDTLIIQLPPEIINVYESNNDGYQVLDVWNIQFPENFTEPPLSSAEENIIKGRLKQRILNQMYEKGYVKKARENAVHSLSILFSKFKDNIIIIDYYPDGWKDNELPPIFQEKKD